MLLQDSDGDDSRKGFSAGCGSSAVKLALDSVEDISGVEVVVNPIVAMLSFQKLERYLVCKSFVFAVVWQGVFSYRASTVSKPTCILIKFNSNDF